MSTIRKITSRHMLVAALVCIPFLMDAQSGKKGRRDQHSPAPVSTSPTDTNYRIIGAPMPPVRVVYPGKTEYTNELLKNDANLILMLFNPTCEHCEEMTINMTRNIKLFHNSHVLLVAADGMEPYLEFFENGTKVQNFPQIKYGVDKSNIVNKVFNYESLPQVNIYDSNRRLIKTFNGITEIDSLKQYIQ